MFWAIININILYLAWAPLEGGSVNMIDVSSSEKILEECDAENSGGDASLPPWLAGACRKKVAGFLLPGFWGMIALFRARYCQNVDRSQD
jgi:hypothetical protein